MKIHFDIGINEIPVSPDQKYSINITEYQKFTQKELDATNDIHNTLMFSYLSLALSSDGGHYYKGKNWYIHQGYDGLSLSRSGLFDLHTKFFEFGNILGLNGSQITVTRNAASVATHTSHSHYPSRRFFREFFTTRSSYLTSPKSSLELLDALKVYTFRIPVTEPLHRPVFNEYYNVMKKYYKSRSRYYRRSYVIEYEQLKDYSLLFHIPGRFLKTIE